MRKFKEKLKKTLSILLIFSLVAGYSMPPISFAEEITTDTSQQTIDNSATVDSSTTTSSDTGNNSINPTPTPEETSTDSTSSPQATDPSPTPSIASDGTASVENSAQLNNNISSDSNTGENTIATPSATLEEAASATESGGTIDTGNAVSVTNVENSLNTTSVNAEVIYQTINLFMDKNGNLNISDPFTIAASVIPEHPEDSVINVSVTNVNNFAYLSNDVISYANTGSNSINGSNIATTSAVINTGDAYSLVSLLNKVNFTIINSKLHIISINIFGNLNGNIVLPNLTESQSANCDTCGISLSASNNAVLENNVDSAAVTGENSTSGLSGNITTGNANSIVNLLNILNTTFFGTAVRGLYINILGSWIGNFIGWGALGSQAGGTGLVFYQTGPAVGNGNGCPSCIGDTSIQNNASVINNISSTANTGGDTINGGNGTITTGNAFSAVSLINFINTNFINSFGFFGFVNIFGNWTGDIGGQEEFEALNVPSQNIPSQNIPSQSNGAQTASSNSENNGTREEGGLLSVTQTNNVGEYVLPGDTVTFFIKVKNLGKGKLYETKLGLVLIKDGKEAGGTVFNLGVIEPGKSLKITTGLVLSKLAPGGEYVARATAAGLTGQDNKKLFAIADSDFKIFSGGFAGLGSEEKPQKIDKMVLGTVAKPENRTKAKNDQVQKLYLLLILTAYTGIKVIRKRKIIGELFNSRLPVKVRLYTLRSILL